MALRVPKESVMSPTAAWTMVVAVLRQQARLLVSKMQMYVLDLHQQCSADVNMSVNMNSNWSTQHESVP